MLKRKKPRERGKLSLSRYFEKFKQGERVAIVRELSQKPSFPKRIQGLVGVIEEKRGKSYVVKLKQGNKEKTHIIKAIHLKKVK